MRLPLYALALIGLIAPALADDSQATGLTGLKPVTHEDVWLMRRLSTPRVSPDGKWVVFSVTEPSYEKDATVHDLWVVPVDGSRPARRLCRGGVANSAARTCPAQPHL